jgi:hypothetical protein
MLLRGTPQLHSSSQSQLRLEPHHSSPLPFTKSYFSSGVDPKETKKPPAHELVSIYFKGILKTPTQEQ